MKPHLLLDFCTKSENFIHELRNPKFYFTLFMAIIGMLVILFMICMSEMLASEIEALTPIECNPECSIVRQLAITHQGPR